MGRDTFIKIALSIPLLDNLFYQFLERRFQVGAELQPSSPNHDDPWIIRISAPSGQASKNWGDTHFANDLAESLEKLSKSTKICFRDQSLTFQKNSRSVVLTIRGLIPMRPVKNAVNILWIISHPAQITKRELSKYDFVFAASDSWALEYSRKWNIQILPLLQATNTSLFKPADLTLAKQTQLLFIGNTRGVNRSSVRIASKVSDDLVVIGSGWQDLVTREQLKYENISHEQVATEYQKASVVLCDHWPDMAKHGFISNRVFDALACGATVISDHVIGIDELFDNAVLTYRTTTELEKLLQNLNLSDIDISKRIQLVQSIEKNHSFDVRAQTLVDTLKQIKT
jgi:hypothetical protein